MSLVHLHESRVGTTTRAFTPGSGLAEALHDGDAEAEGLACARLGLADHVLTGSESGIVCS